METTHTLLTADGARIAYRRWHAPAASALPPIVLLHGAASNLTRWSEFVELTALSQTRDILRLDLRGHGESVYRGKIGLEIWADDVAAILKQEGLARTIVGGHCLGANVAAVFAARHPGLATGVLLVEPMLRPALTGTLHKLIPFTPLLKLVIAALRVGNRLGIYRRQLETLDLRELDREFRRRLAQPGGGDVLVKRYASPLHDLKIMPAANFLQDLVEVTRPLPLTGIRAPFLALLSAGRHFADPVVTAELLKPFANGEVHTLDAKHWIPTEQPEAMRKQIEDWCAKLR
jgi:pimeloyl-ACP methyl ester carboxylesterase